MNQKHTTRSLRAMQNRGERIAMVTAYDAGQASMLETAGIDVILVGDSLGNVVLGYDSTIPVTIDDMVHHAKAVRRGAPQTMMLVDMPFLTYRQSVEHTVRQAGRLMQEAHADGVKVEGGADIAEHVQALTAAGIPVCGHLGLTPQAVLQMGGYRVQGRDEEAAKRMITDAQALVDAGIFLLVLECIPLALGAALTELLPVPTIGIGAGVDCAGQVLVFHDLLGLGASEPAKFVKPFASLRDHALAGLQTYRDEVKSGSFPSTKYSYDIGGDVIARIYNKAHTDSAT